MAEEPAMWPYWRDDKGLDAALRDYYPQTVLADPRLQQAVAMRESAEIIIETVMRELAGRDADG